MGHCAKPHDLFVFNHLIMRILSSTNIQLENPELKDLTEWQAGRCQNSNDPKDPNFIIFTWARYWTRRREVISSMCLSSKEERD